MPKRERRRPRKTSINELTAAVVVNAGELGLWMLLEQEIEQGLPPQLGHIVHALRQGVPVGLSPKLQTYLADLLSMVPQKRSACRPKKTTGRRMADAYALRNRVESEIAREQIARGKKGSTKRAFQNLGTSVARRYREACRLLRGTRITHPPGNGPQF